MRSETYAFLIFALLAAICLASCSLLETLLPLASKLSPIPIAKPIYGGDVKLGDGDLVGRSLYVYKCKVCEMPRMFKMNHASSWFG